MYCSFCGKSQHEVHKLIAGPSVYICDECVDLCNDIIREEANTKDPISADGKKLPTPKEICAIFELHIHHGWIVLIVLRGKALLEAMVINVNSSGG